ncbi:RNA polymerase sigma factor [Kineosporia succinea]|uniref:RNA polymerase sigma-70 factor (ECF subfamily) n=1 Tax=Kineosporia succinea TaxID=84632 RepID=A0ABT9P998_9ACTN|nr:RNA polymerase sigma factor [Kineosporia succinea]MDP9829037.1 RNA polymerase sigma-70 factor (ECF subfamily) [Kineosporia succinea]
MNGLSDTDLVLAAQRGDVGALGVLLQRHRAGMTVAAVGVLGHRPEIEDVVQDSCLIVLRRLGDLREPQAFGGWVRTVVRNQARQHLRSRTALVMPDLEGTRPAPHDRDDPHDLDPARLAERHALGDWVWQALDQLSPEHRLVTMLRYFTEVTAYEQIAAICGVPVGTVRSRLNHARSRMTQALDASADRAHDDHRALTRMRHRQAVETLEAGRTGRFAEAMGAICRPTLETVWAKGKRTHGLGYPTLAMYRDVGDGVRFEVAGVVAGRDVVIWETDLISPPEDPAHCPPSALWVHSLTDGLGDRLRVFHPRPAVVT